jgi:transmembrane sensor
VPASPNRQEAHTAEAATYLTAGERAVVSLHETVPALAVATVPEAEMKRVLAWQPRLLDFEAAPLRDIVAEFNARNAPYHLVVADTRLAELQVSATLRSDNIEGFLRLLESSFSVRIDRIDHTVILRGR